jgi:hypothetical protein
MSINGNKDDYILGNKMYLQGLSKSLDDQIFSLYIIVTAVNDICQ